MPWAGCIIFRQLVPAAPPQVALIRSRKRGRDKIANGTHTLDTLDLELPKGGFETGKDGSLREAALREAREELGMTPAQQAPALLTEVGHLSGLGNGGLNELWIFIYGAACGEGGIKVNRAPAEAARTQDRSSSVALSKALSQFLRHNKQARKHNFIDDEGFAPVKQLAKKIGFVSACVEEEVRKIVENDSKQRFSLREDCGTLYLRCNQGHSIDVPGLALRAFVCPPAGSPPATVVHGTDEESWRLIQASGGLNRMGRAHIHFAQGLPGATGVISGMRVACKVHIYIDAAAVLAAGIPLLVSENGVVLCPGQQNSGVLPAHFFSRVVVRGSDVDGFKGSSVRCCEAAAGPPAGPARPTPSVIEGHQVAANHSAHKKDHLQTDGAPSQAAKCKKDFSCLRSQLDQEVEEESPLPGEKLSDFFKRTSMIWLAKAKKSLCDTADAKELRRVGFGLAQARFETLRPLLEHISKLEQEQRIAEAESGDRTAETINFALTDELSAGWVSCDHPQIRADHARFIHRALRLPAVVSALRREPHSERRLHQGVASALCANLVETDELFCRLSYGMYGL